MVGDRTQLKHKVLATYLRAPFAWSLPLSPVGVLKRGPAYTKTRMEELLTAQKSTWEEKEKLSRQLEDERQNNINAAIGQARHR